MYLYSLKFKSKFLSACLVKLFHEIFEDFITVVFIKDVVKEICKLGNFVPSVLP